MCGLCGAFGAAGDWAEEAGAGGILGRELRGVAASRILTHHGLRLQAWGGRYVLRGATGRTALVDHLSACWPAAEALAGRPLDPLDPRLLETLERG